MNQNDPIKRETTFETTQNRFDTFQSKLTEAFSDLFKNDPRFSVIAARSTPESHANKVAQAAYMDEALIDGPAVKRACKELGIKQTKKGLRAWFADPTPVSDETVARL